MPSRTKIDNILATLLPVIKTEQDNYHNAMGRYKQYKVAELYDWVEVHQQYDGTNKGYVIVLTAVEGLLFKTKYTKKIGLGVLGLDLTSDWTEMVE